jgi:hypothetical protein
VRDDRLSRIDRLRGDPTSTHEVVLYLVAVVEAFSAHGSEEDRGFVCPQHHKRTVRTLIWVLTVVVFRF